MKASPSLIMVKKKKIQISNPDRIMFPDAKITKGELIEYYAAVAPLMVPLVKSHLLTLQRYPSGITKEGFFQKDAGSYFPSWINKKRLNILTIRSIMWWPLPQKPLCI